MSDYRPVEFSPQITKNHARTQFTRLLFNLADEKGVYFGKLLT